MVFLGNNEREVMILNRSGEIDYFFSRHPMIPEDMRSLLGGMLQKSPERRLNIRAVLDHPFF
jgi:serine/threonine protein kinase